MPTRFTVIQLGNSSGKTYGYNAGAEIGIAVAKAVKPDSSSRRGIFVAPNDDILIQALNDASAAALRRNKQLEFMTNYDFKARDLEGDPFIRQGRKGAQFLLGDEIQIIFADANLVKGPHADIYEHLSRLASAEGVRSNSRRAIEIVDREVKLRKLIGEEVVRFKPADSDAPLDRSIFKPRAGQRHSWELTRTALERTFNEVLSRDTEGLITKSGYSDAEIKQLINVHVDAQVRERGTDYWPKPDAKGRFDLHVADQEGIEQPNTRFGSSELMAAIAVKEGASHADIANGLLHRTFAETTSTLALKHLGLDKALFSSATVSGNERTLRELGAAIIKLTPDTRASFNNGGRNSLRADFVNDGSAREYIIGKALEAILGQEKIVITARRGGQLEQIHQELVNTKKAVLKKQAAGEVLTPAEQALLATRISEPALGESREARKVKVADTKDQIKSDPNSKVIYIIQGLQAGDNIFAIEGIGNLRGTLIRLGIGTRDTLDQLAGRLNVPGRGEGEYHVVISKSERSLDNSDYGSLTRAKTPQDKAQVALSVAEKMNIEQDMRNLDKVREESDKIVQHTGRQEATETEAKIMVSRFIEQYEARAKRSKTITNITDRYMRSLAPALVNEWISSDERKIATNPTATWLDKAEAKARFLSAKASQFQEGAFISSTVIPLVGFLRNIGNDQSRIKYLSNFIFSLKASEDRLKRQAALNVFGFQKQETLAAVGVMYDTARVNGIHTAGISLEQVLRSWAGAKTATEGIQNLVINFAPDSKRGYLRGAIKQINDSKGNKMTVNQLTEILSQDKDSAILPERLYTLLQFGNLKEGFDAIQRIAALSIDLRDNLAIKDYFNTGLVIRGLLNSTGPLLVDRSRIERIARLVMDEGRLKDRKLKAGLKEVQEPTVEAVFGVALQADTHARALTELYVGQGLSNKSWGEFDRSRSQLGELGLDAEQITSLPFAKFYAWHRGELPEDDLRSILELSNTPKTQQTKEKINLIANFEAQEKGVEGDYSIASLAKADLNELRDGKTALAEQNVSILLAEIEKLAPDNERLKAKIMKGEELNTEEQLIADKLQALHNQLAGLTPQEAAVLPNGLFQQWAARRAGAGVELQRAQEAHEAFLLRNDIFGARAVENNVADRLIVDLDSITDTEERIAVEKEVEEARALLGSLEAKREAQEKAQPNIPGQGPGTPSIIEATVAKFEEARKLRATDARAARLLADEVITECTDLIADRKNAPIGTLGAEIKQQAERIKSDATKLLIDLVPESALFRLLSEVKRMPVRSSLRKAPSLSEPASLRIDVFHGY